MDSLSSRPAAPPAYPPDHSPRSRPPRSEEYMIGKSPISCKNNKDNNVASSIKSASVYSAFGLLVLAVLLARVYQERLEVMWSTTGHLLTAALAVGGFAANSPDPDTATVDINWYPPAQTKINNLSAVVSEEGVYGFIYNTSETPSSQYGTYNWCNMPHVRKDIYVKAPKEYELVYVELIHRHHKRTPYAANSFPVEPYQWHCDDEGLFYHGQPFTSHSQPPTPSYWKNYISPINPFKSPGWTGTCQFPQITSSGLSDSWQHGTDLYEVYHSLLNFLPDRNHPSKWRSVTAYRVTNNVITSQVSGMLLNGMWRTTSPTPLIIQPSTIDSLEPKYDCPAARSLFSSIQSNPRWSAHLTAAKALYAKLDDISSIPPDETNLGFHTSLDHYYDNLSARQCHQKPFPCKLVDGRNDTSKRITQPMADETYRFGHWEYSHLYRDAGPETLAASVASMGVWIAELAGNLREVVDGMNSKGQGSIIWRHHVAHDGSLSRVLSVLQVDEMVWPGMGSEVVFELFRRRKEKGGGYFVRVLFSGRVLKSSNPSLGVIDMVPVEKVLAYFDGLVGKGAGLVVGKCAGKGV